MRSGALFPTMRGQLLVAALAAANLVLPAAACACSSSGKLAGLLHYAGQSRGADGGMDADPAVLAHLQRLPDEVRAHLHRNLDVQGTVDLVSCHLVIEGNAAHEGGLENAILDVNLYSGAVTAGLLSGGRITIYLDSDPTAGTRYDASVPPAVRTWAALAASGFHPLAQPPPQARIVRPH